MLELMSTCSVLCALPGSLWTCRPCPGFSLCTQLAQRTPQPLSFLPQPGPITEVDGAVASDFFTVLSTGQYFTEDQWLNVQAFSMLRAWLLHKAPEGPGTLDTGAPG